MSINDSKPKEDVIEALHNVAAEMHDKMLKGIAPTMTLPVRTKSNIGFDDKLGVYKYGRRRPCGMLLVWVLLGRCCAHCMSLNS